MTEKLVLEIGSFLYFVESLKRHLAFGCHLKKLYVWHGGHVEFLRHNILHKTWQMQFKYD
jgi:hypothetical protein